MNKDFFNPYKGLSFLMTKISKFIKNDETYLKWKFFANLHYWPDLKNPKTYNEKIQWLKIHYHDPLMTQLVDKYEVKKYVAEILGEGHTFPLLGVWDRPEDIDFDSLPNQFVLKCNHNSTGLVICKDKAKGIIVKGKSDDKTNMSYDEVRSYLKQGLEKEFFHVYREWPYKDVKRKIIAEKYMVQSDGSELNDYKILCFDGEPKYIWTGTNYAPTHFDIYNTKWENQHVAWGYDMYPEDLPKPERFEEMLEIARKLSKGFPHVRIDLYNIDGTIYLGEFTFYTWAGLCKLVPEKWDSILGDLIKLPAK